MDAPTRYQLQLAEAKSERGLAILHRLVPAPDHGAGWKRDPETGFVFYSSEWLSDEYRTANPPNREPAP